jgi:CRISPR-associated endonuclease/helicase Cas3
MREQDQALCILNTRRDAVAVARELGEDALHLSTLMCPAHRRATLAEVRRRLEEGESCHLASTQVVEAGVDLDFPLVLRALGPLDRLVQAAGRCNREGRRESGTVVVFQPEDTRLPQGPYATGLAQARLLLDRGDCDLHDPEIFTRYFQGLWQNVDLDEQDIQLLRRRFDFPEVDRRFRLIPSSTLPVLVNYDAAGVEAILSAARGRGCLDWRDWRRLQPHLVMLYEYETKRLAASGLLAPEPLGGDLYRWLGSYHPRFGLAPDLPDPTDLIV